MRSFVRWDGFWKRKQRQLNGFLNLSCATIFSGLSSVSQAFAARFTRKRTSDNVSYVRFGGRFSLGNRRIGIIVRAGNGTLVWDVGWVV